MFLAEGAVQFIREVNYTNHVITEMRHMKYKYWKDSRRGLRTVRINAAPYRGTKTKIHFKDLHFC